MSLWSDFKALLFGEVDKEEKDSEMHGTVTPSDFGWEYTTDTLPGKLDEMNLPDPDNTYEENK